MEDEKASNILKPGDEAGMTRPFVDLYSLCGFVIVGVETGPQKFLPGRTICSLLSLDGYGLGRSLVDI